MRWPDGTPRSRGNAFDWNNGEPSIFWSEAKEAAARRLESKAKGKSSRAMNAETKAFHRIAERNFDVRKVGRNAPKREAG